MVKRTSYILYSNGEQEKEGERASGAVKKRRFLLLNYSWGLLLVCYRAVPTLLLLSMPSR